MAKLKIIWSVEAKDKFQQIASFYNDCSGNTKYTRKLYGMIKASLRLIARYPYMYRSSSVPDTRVFVCEYFKVYYSVHSEYILVESIFDTRQNPSKDAFL